MGAAIGSFTLYLVLLVSGCVLAADTATHSLRIVIQGGSGAGEIAVEQVEVAVRLDEVDLDTAGEVFLQTTVLQFGKNERGRTLVASLSDAFPAGITLQLQVGNGGRVGLGEQPADIFGTSGAETGERVEIRLFAVVDPDAGATLDFSDGPPKILFTLIETV